MPSDCPVFGVVAISALAPASGGVDGVKELGVGQGAQLYQEALRLFQSHCPVVAAIQAAAIGGGLGARLFSGFALASPGKLVCCEFSRLGIHHGFGLSVSSPSSGRITRARFSTRVIVCLLSPLSVSGFVIALSILTTCVRRAKNSLVPSPPLLHSLVMSIRETLRSGLIVQLEEAMPCEDSEQERLRKTQDWI